MKLTIVCPKFCARSSFSLLLLLFVVSAAFAQQKYLPVKQLANQYYSEQKYGKAALLFEELTDKPNADVNDCYSAACCRSLLGEKDAAFALLDKALDMGWTDAEHMKADTDLDTLHTDRRWPLMVIKADSVNKSITLKYAAVVRLLDTLLVADQRYRIILADSVLPVYGHNSPQEAHTYALMRVADSINLITAAAILDQYGWLGPMEIGYDAARNLFALVQHSPDSFLKKCYPSAVKAFEAGKIIPPYFATLQDRYLLSIGKKQQYGTQVTYNVKTEKYELLPVEHINELNRLRKEMNLSTINDYLATFQRHK